MTRLKSGRVGKISIPACVCNIYTDPGARFSMHVTRNLCDRQRETGNPKWRKFPSNLPYRTSSGSQIQLVILDERELVSPACQRLLRRASIGSISANSLFLSLSPLRKHVLFVFNLKITRGWILAEKIERIF